jgi:hypothetical protein
MPTTTHTTSGSCSGSEGARARARGGARRRLAAGLGAAALAALAWAALAPIRTASRERLFEIPQGTWARRMSGDPVEILPGEIRLTLGLEDVLLLRNGDDVPQIFGPTLLMPRQSFRLPFAVASSYQFACTAHASGQLVVEVEPRPETPWARLRWRARALVERARAALASRAGEAQGPAWPR